VSKTASSLLPSHRGNIRGQWAGNVAFDAVYTRVRETLLTKLPDVMQQYYIAKIEPALRNNMEAMWHVRWLD